MRSLVCLSFCLVLFLLCLTAEASHRSSTCCLKTSKDRIHKNRVVSYTVQKAGVCPINAIVLLTIKRKIRCFDPDSEWIKEIMDQKKMTDPKALPSQNAKRQKKNNKGKRRRQKNQKKF
ncbi:C-C motif chemokine 20-like [Sinocyclocheilus grahami]|uniref:C-C motif chemokine 20-like n=1 Tax=Sinocyclocheilus grahami TaxID=75366 RepID=UPI0007AC660B|nr:PREDICTED: C-C motif chemokine 20-like [Sinocyclocheilus grahami]